MKNWLENDINKEIERIQTFICNFVLDGEAVVVPVSGGLDSDVVARLCCRSLGSSRVKAFIVIQSDMEPKFLKNAKNLCGELGIPLAEIHLENMNQDLMKALEKSESKTIFNTDMMLDPAKAKCSVRSAVISCYQDKGFLIAGTTNRTEKELGFFLTFGDNLAHFKPVAHLYKSELEELAAALGTEKVVIEQEPSAGFWSGQTDLEDIAYWIVNDGPIVIPRVFSEQEIIKAENIRNALDYKKIDHILELISSGESVEGIQEKTDVSAEIIAGLYHIVEKAKRLKTREIMAELPAHAVGGM